MFMAGEREREREKQSRADNPGLLGTSSLSRFSGGGGTLENGHGHGRKENASRLTTAAIILETRKKVSCDIALFPRGHFFFSRDAVVSTKLFFSCLRE